MKPLRTVFKTTDLASNTLRLGRFGAYLRRDEPRHDVHDRRITHECTQSATDVHGPAAITELRIGRHLALTYRTSWAYEIH
jgi:hypothetical protein